MKATPTAVDVTDFSKIAPRSGDQNGAFEELCCQLAYMGRPSGSSFFRLRGAGGDGGVECYADLADGSRIGWQAKFVFEIDGLLKQLSNSLQTALTIHPKLTKYIVCFPFNPTGPTGRKGQNELEKFEKWRKKEEAVARKKGRRLVIEDWPASRLVSELLKNDISGGIRSYFFEETVLSDGWFNRHLEEARLAAGPRYTPTLRVETDLWKWFNAFGQTSEWSQELDRLLKEFRAELEDLQEAVKRVQSGPMDPAWPEQLRTKAVSCISNLESLDSACLGLNREQSRQVALECASRISQCLGELRELESGLKYELEAQHGTGTADSPGFRQFMAEYQVSFPTANLDYVRDVTKTVEALADWLNSPAGWLAFETTFLLLGAPGTGKTHGVCDAATRRTSSGRLSVVTFGHMFGGEPDPWTRMCENLSLPGTLGRDGLLDSLNAAATASGWPLIIFIDAINETKPRKFWRERLVPLADAVSRRPFLRLCVTCKTSYAPYCVPEGNGFYFAEHRGFVGIEQEACRAFFAYYNLDPPIVPVLQPELANPLYLSLVCKTLRAQGLRSLPSGWMGLSAAINAFLSEKNHAFALENDITQGAAAVSRALSAVASEIARLGETSLNRSVAERIVRDAVPGSTPSQLLDWLVREELLIEDAPRAGAALDAEGVVRPAFERLGDFLVAQELLSEIDMANFRTAYMPGGRLAPYFASEASIGNSEGIISALSILVPEQYAPGRELPDLFDEGPVQTAVLKIAISSYPWRHPTSFTAASAANLRKALATAGFAHPAMDVALTVCSQASTVDANWLHALLSRRPMAIRDSFWCGYLHSSYEEKGTVWRLINSALQLPLAKAEPEVAERWTMALFWLTAAADRRVKDFATRSAIAILLSHPNVLPNILGKMMEVDDDSILERVLLSAYGVGLLTRDAQMLAAICAVLANSLAANPSRFHNALLRDHSRVIAEFAELIGVHGRQLELISILDGLKSPWPLRLPTDEQIKEWDKLPKLAHSCLHDDFFVYSMNCLDEWTEAVPKKDMGKWILRRIVEDFRYLNSGCERYDGYMLGKYGGGRSKPTWAERIGKKYQWIALYELAARLSDHTVRKRNRWEPEPLRKPLILAEERQMDPTLPQDTTYRKRASAAWWIPISVDLSAATKLTDEEWVKDRSDVPSLEKLLVPIENGEKQWLLLHGYPSWDSRLEGEPYSTPYRNLWTQLRGFMVNSVDREKAFASIEKRNLFHRWLPEGAIWLYGFIGEYPWAAPFNTEPESYYGRGRGDSALPCEFFPTYVDLAAEWQYDASRAENVHIGIPARIFFEPDDLRWNGHDAFVGKDQEAVMRLPYLIENGPTALVASVDALSKRLARLDKTFIWTLLGEKIIIAGSSDARSPRRTFSQIAMRLDDGTMKFSKMVFFDDYNKDVGPWPNIGKKAAKMIPRKKERRKLTGKRKPSRA